MTHCARCNGNVLQRYDDGLREYYDYCLQCSHRPAMPVVRSVGPPKCSQSCGRYCLEVTDNKSRAKVYLTKCAVCREKWNIQRKAAKLRREQTGTKRIYRKRVVA